MRKARHSDTATPVSARFVPLADTSSLGPASTAAVGPVHQLRRWLARGVEVHQLAGRVLEQERFLAGYVLDVTTRVCVSITDEMWGRLKPCMGVV